MKGKLTERQLRFIEVYNGNATEAARLAGYTGTDATLCQMGYENLRKPEIVDAIRERRSIEFGPAIASRIERQAFWTKIMKSEEQDLSARLRASELLGKSEADFVDRLQVSGKLTLEELVLESMQKPVEGEPTDGE